MPTAGAAMILGNVVVFWVPVSELDDLDALSLGVASFSGPVEDPYGVNGVLDRSPEPQQPLTPLDEVGVLGARFPPRAARVTPRCVRPSGLLSLPVLWLGSMLATCKLRGGSA